MHAHILGIGALGPGFCDWPSLRDLMQQNSTCVSNPPQTSIPNPAIIPTRERRRAPALVRMAVDVATQACEHAKISPEETACVFGSSMGDSEITDYMCGCFAADSQVVSPTKFHNSVHNAATGYWSIATGCRQSLNSMSAFDLTTSVALLEAMIFCNSEQRPILMVLFDIVPPDKIRDIVPITDSFAAALVLSPGSDTTNTKVDNQPTITLSLSSGLTEWPTMNWLQNNSALDQLYNSNPSARVLALLELINRGGSSMTTMPVGEDTSLSVSVAYR